MHFEYFGYYRFLVAVMVREVEEVTVLEWNWYVLPYAFVAISS